jgi:hypothetical protein
MSAGVPIVIRTAARSVMPTMSQTMVSRSVAKSVLTTPVTVPAPTPAMMWLTVEIGLLGQPWTVMTATIQVNLSTVTALADRTRLMW